MKIAIVYAPEAALPSIFYGKTMSAILDQLRGIAFAPELPDEIAARRWLAALPEPSGLFLSTEEAAGHLARIREARDPGLAPDDVAKVRETLRLSRAAFAEAIGFGGNANTRHKLIWEIENGKKPISAAMATKIRALASEGALSD